MSRLLKTILFGIVGGVIGIVLTTCFSVVVPETGSLVSVRDTPAILLAFYVGSWPAFIAGALTAVGRAIVGICGSAGTANWIESSLATLFATFVAIGVRKFIFVKKRPGFMAAGMMAFIAEIMHMEAVLLVGINLSQSFAIVMYALPLQCGGTAFIVAVSSFIFRVKQNMRENVRLALVTLLILVLVGLGWYSMELAAQEVASSTVTQAYSAEQYQRDLSMVLMTIILAFLWLVLSFVSGKAYRQRALIAEMNKKDEERIKQEMKLAASIQRSALPYALPSVASDIHAVIREAREVGGDFYDFFEVMPGRLFFLIADVSGKGIPASLFMMRSKMEFRSIAEHCDNLEEIAYEVNNRLCRHNEAMMFLTAWMGIYDESTGILEYISAGHNPPFVKHKDGCVERISDACGCLMGSAEELKYASSRMEFKAGDSLFLYTDGVTEARNSSRDFFGEKRLETKIHDMEDKSSAEFCDEIVKAVDSFAAGVPQADDITVLVIKK